MNKKIVLITILICTMFASFAHAGSTFSRIKTWSSGQTLTAGDLNAEFDNVLNNLDPSGIDDESGNATAMQATADPYPGAAISQPTSLQGEIQRLRYQIAAILGTTYWYQDAPTNLTAPNAATLDTYDTALANATASTTLIIPVFNSSTVLDSGFKVGLSNTMADQGGGSNLQVKVVNIGDWNMNSAASVAVNHGLTLSKIRSITALIRNDSDSTYTHLPSGQISISSTESLYVTGTQIGLARGTGGLFESTDYDSTSYNRGFVTIWYTE